MAKSRRQTFPGNPEEPEAVTVPPSSAVPQPTGGAAVGTPYAEPGPTERVYAVAFGRVWRAALAATGAMSRWTVTSSNSVRGEISIAARGLLSKNTRSARVVIALDRVGLTRVDAVFLGPAGEPAEGVEARQIERFHRQVETLLRRDFRA